MAHDASINLFESKAALSPTMLLIEKYSRQLRYILLFVVCGLGILTLGLFIFVRVRTSSLESQQQTLMSSIQQEKLKEGMFLALRARIVSLQKIMNIQISIAPYIDTTLLIAAPPRLTSFTIGDNNTIEITVELPDMNEAVNLMKLIVELAGANTIRNPGITSLTVNKNGSVQLGLVYTVVLVPSL